MSFPKTLLTLVLTLSMTVPIGCATTPGSDQRPFTERVAGGLETIRKGIEDARGVIAGFAAVAAGATCFAKDGKNRELDAIACAAGAFVAVQALYELHDHFTEDEVNDYDRAATALANENPNKTVTKTITMGEGSAVVTMEPEKSADEFFQSDDLDTAKLTSRDICRRFKIDKEGKRAFDVRCREGNGWVSKKILVAQATPGKESQPA